MASTPSNRIKLTPSNSPFLSRPPRSPVRPRTPYESCLSLQRVVGTTCSSPTGFDTVHSSFAYIAGGAVVVVDVSGGHYSQRFYRARPSAVPLLSVSPVTHTSSTPISTPKANDSRNRVAASPRDSLHQSADWPDSPASKTWTSRERIKAATCLALSRDGRYLAVGETGYAPRVLIFNLQDASSDIPLVSISEHTFGVRAVAWSPDTRYLASLGAANDGFLYLWKVEARTGAVKLFQQNRCTSFVKGMVWMGSNLITFGVRHVKVWRVEDAPEVSPTKQRFAGDGPAPSAPPPAQRPLPGRNILLGSMLDATFCCALPLCDDKAIICSDAGGVCLLDDTNRQMKLVKALDLGFTISCISSRGESVYIGGREGQCAVIGLDGILAGAPESTVNSPLAATGLIAMGYLAENLVTIDGKRSIDIWAPDHVPGSAEEDPSRIAIPGLGDPIVGIQRLPKPNATGGSFFTWSGLGKVTIWDLDGRIRSSFDIPVEQLDTATEADLVNQVVVARATNDGSLFVTGDKLGVLRIFDVSARECVLETKAHSSNCQDITLHEGKSRFLVASCGRDRTVQLFHRSSAGVFEHFQTLEFSAKVVQVLIPTEDKILTCSLDRTLQLHDVVSREGEPDVMAAIPSRVISLRASPSSIAATPDDKAVFVSLLDRSVCHYDLASGRLLSSFKCNDEAGVDSVVLESLIYGQLAPCDLAFLLGISNTDKSVRIYDAQSGSFIDREWGHTEAIHGVILMDGEEAGTKVVSAGEDGTIMIWALDFQDPAAGSRPRDPSPEKSVQTTSARPPLRRVLSKAELAEFQRPSSTPTTAAGSVNLGRRSPPRPSSHRRPSKFHLPFSSLRTPTAADKQTTTATPTTTMTTTTTTTMTTSPTSTAAMDDTPSRRASSGGGSRSDDSPPPQSPKTRSKMFRRPSMPALGATPSLSSGVKPRKSSSQLNHHHHHHHHHHHSNRRHTRGNGSGGGGNGAGNGNGNGIWGGNGSNSGGGNNGRNVGGYGFGSLSMATEQTCRQLRAYRKKLEALAAAPDAINADVLAQLDTELRLTAAALGERANATRRGSGNGNGNGNGSGSRSRSGNGDGNGNPSTSSSPSPPDRSPSPSRSGSRSQSGSRDGRRGNDNKERKRQRDRERERVGSRDNGAGPGRDRHRDRDRDRDGRGSRGSTDGAGNGGNNANANANSAGNGDGDWSGSVSEGGKGVSETVLSGLLDQYSERLVSMLDEKLRRRLSEEDRDAGEARERPRTAGGEGVSLVASASGSTSEPSSGSASRSGSGSAAASTSAPTTVAVSESTTTSAPGPSGRSRSVDEGGGVRL